MQVDTDGPLSFFGHEADMPLFFAETDDVPVLAAPVRAGDRALVDSLEEVRFSLRIVAEDHIRSGIEFDLDALIIPVLVQFQRAYDHTMLTVSP